jgi:exonuclease III
MQVHILCISESHTNNTQSTSELKIPGYRLERKDRSNGPHGGVCIYIRDDISYQRRTDLETEELELLWIEICIPNSKSFLLCSAYRPPDSSKYICKNFSDRFDDVLSTVSAENKESFIAGDLNCDYKVSNDHIDIKDLINSYGFHQLIKSPTRTTINS